MKLTSCSRLRARRNKSTKALDVKNILVTGGAGFIGSHVVRLLVERYSDYRIVNFDKLTYAGNLDNLTDVASAANYHFVKGDITDYASVEAAFEDYDIDTVIHLAAESHVDRSIENPNVFIDTNVMGTATLLNAARAAWANDFSDKRFYHVSTDEVYGSLYNDDEYFTEDTPYDPKSPYSASKAASDHLVRAYHNTYQLPVVISNCSNNYGPNQFPEKLIPLFIQNIIDGKPLPVYGKGINVRDWLYVVDHARAIDVILHKGKDGETYNIGGHNEWQNIELIKVLCKAMDRKLNRSVGSSEALISYVTDRAGHDMRYAIDATKLKEELGWVPSLQFEEGLDKTIDWYLANTDWLDRIKSGEYRSNYTHQVTS